ncbi:hypothetical protein C5745_08140 [Sphingobacterium haloxyli]|uniref:Uncharacterized protein n=1 Tax=Sphingobacterium haloxyli TaxID=2100533 RepID=A0A2S9J533_9SPHI|nr:hypothetical protein C5745_08140 [Sphingobacterium haloxyli]
MKKLLTSFYLFIEKQTKIKKTVRNTRIVLLSYLLSGQPVSALRLEASCIVTKKTVALFCNRFKLFLNDVRLWQKPHITVHLLP